MEKSKNIFDLNDVSDLPEDIKAKIIKRRAGSIQEQMLNVLKELNGESVHVQQIQVAIYRKFGNYKTAYNVRNAIFRLRNKGLINRVGNGMYTLNKNS